MQIEEQARGKWNAENRKSGPGLHLHQWGRKTGRSHPHSRRGNPPTWNTHQSCRCTHSSAHSRVSFQIITKEAVANDWKTKYEDSRQEVSEMRWDNLVLCAFHSAVKDWFWGRSVRRIMCFVLLQEDCCRIWEDYRADDRWVEMLGTIIYFKWCGQECSLYPRWKATFYAVTRRNSTNIVLSTPQQPLLCSPQRTCSATTRAPRRLCTLWQRRRKPLWQTWTLWNALSPTCFGVMKPWRAPWRASRK